MSSNEEDPIEIKVSQLQAVRLLIQVGQWEDAHALLEQVRPKNEDEWAEQLFLLGFVELRLGKPTQAIERFERILKRHPHLIRVRLELAAAYYATGLDDKARAQFETSLEHELPDSVEDVVDRFLHQIDTRKTWSSSFSAALLPEDRPKKISGQDEIVLGGLPFKLDEDARPRSGIGLQLSGGIAYSPVIAEDLRGLVAISSTAKVYPRAVWNDISIATDAGLTHFFRRGTVSEGLRFAWQWRENDRYRRSIGVWMRMRLGLSDKFGLELPISLDFHKHDTRDYLDGPELVMTPSLTHFIGRRSLIAFKLKLGRTDAEQAYHRYDLLGLSLQFKHIFENDLSLTLEPYYETRSYAAQDPLLGIVRSDKLRRYRISLSHPSWRYKSFITTLTYSHDTSWSNFPAPRKYRSQGLNLGMFRLF